MKKKIKKLLREWLNNVNEVMIPIDGNKFHEHGNDNYVVLAKDDETGKFLLLFVELYPDKDRYRYSYYFQLYDRNQNHDGRMYNRGEAMEFLPNEIRKDIIPLVKTMTINLINRIDPNLIYRESSEILNNRMMGRYNEISNLLQSELGYELIEQGRNKYGNNFWWFRKNGQEIELNEQDIEDFYTSNPERLKRLYIEIDKEKWESLRLVWDEHRRIDEENIKKYKEDNGLL